MGLKAFVDNKKLLAYILYALLTQCSRLKQCCAWFSDRETDGSIIAVTAQALYCKCKQTYLPVTLGQMVRNMPFISL